MKKTSLLFVAFSLLGLLLSGCSIEKNPSNGTDSNHVHTYSSDWSYDGDYHWHAATCEHTYEKSNKERHSFTDTVVSPTYESKGYTLHTCTVCNYSFKDNYTDQLKRSFIITWQNWDGTELKSDVLEEGTMPSYSGEEPTRDSDSQYCYKFKGWTPEITKVTENATYVATFTELEIWDGSYVQPSQLKNIDGVYYYCINNAKELAYLSYASGDWLSYNYILNNDIVLNDFALEYDEDGLITSDTSNLNEWKMINSLVGTLEGDGHSIVGLYINASGKQSFINSISTDLNGINLVNSYIRSSTSNCAGICLNASSHTIRNCSFSGCVSGQSSVGGITSDLTGYVRYCENRADIFSKGSAGGICSNIVHWGVENCTNYGNIHSDGDYVGGICGQSGLYTYDQCLNYGNIVGRNYVGGLAGTHGDSWSRGSNYGKVTGENYVGGLFGMVNNSQLRGSTTGNNYGEIKGKIYVGGLIGYMKYLEVFDSNNYANVSGDEYVGGLIGYSDSIWGRGVVRNCTFAKNDTINTNLNEFGNTPE